MVKTGKFERQNTADKLTAHLALATADEGAPQQECLDSGELADMVAGHCTAEQREKAIAHLSSCQKCYDGWLAASVSHEDGRSGAVSTRRLLMSVRNLVYLGSALAIAASVVMFLNIREGALESQLVSPPAYEETPASADLMEVAAEKEEADSAPARIYARKLSENEERPVEKKEELLSNRTLRQKQAIRAEGPATLLVQAGEAGDWLAYVRDVCESPPVEMNFWHHLHKSGEEILDFPVDESRLVQEQRARVIKVLGLIAGIADPGQAADQCARIRRLLAQKADKE